MTVFICPTVDWSELTCSYSGVGVSLSRDSATLMVGQYFKRRREMVEMVLVSSHGAGIVLISQLLHNSLRRFGWRFGLQVTDDFLRLARI